VLRVWDAQTWELRFPIDLEPESKAQIIWADFTENSQQILVWQLLDRGRDNVLTVLDADTGEVHSKVVADGVRFLNDFLSCNGDGTRVALSDKVRDGSDSELLSVYSITPSGAGAHAEYVLNFSFRRRDNQPAAFSSDGRRIAVADDRAIRILDVPGGREVFAVHGHTRPITHLKFSPNGQVLVSASEDVMKFWDAIPKEVESPAK
jgi:WD40 repeat protein